MKCNSKNFFKFCQCGPYKIRKYAAYKFLLIYWYIW